MSLPRPPPRRNRVCARRIFEVRGTRVFETLRNTMKAAGSKGRTRRSARRARIALPTRQVLAHPHFVPLLTIWGAALLGCAVLAVSSVDIERISRFAGLGALGFSAKFLYAAIAAAIGAFVAFVASSLMQRFFEESYYARPPARLTDDRVRPIEPALELGSESLDAPIEEMPFSSPKDDVDEEQLEDAALDDAAFEEAWVEAEISEVIEEEDEAEDQPEAVTLDAMAALEEESAPVADIEDAHAEHSEVEGPVDPTDRGVDMDALGEILEEETQDFEARKAARDEARRTGRPVETAIAQPLPFKSTLPPNGIAKLRQMPTQDLSLIQLVERFAAALHEVQDKTPQDVFGAGAAAGQAERERALAEALKALDLFTGGRFDSAAGANNSSPAGQSSDSEASRLSEAERDLREALGKLQTLRGAA